MPFEMIVHGGAWSIPDASVKRSLAGCERAARVGRDILENGGRAIDAVEAAVNVLEDDSVFDGTYASVI